MICNMNIGHKRETKEEKRELSTWHFCLIGLSSLMIGAKELFLSEIVAFNWRTWRKNDQLLVNNIKKNNTWTNPVLFTLVAFAKNGTVEPLPINEKNLWVCIL